MRATVDGRYALNLEESRAQLEVSGLGRTGLGGRWWMVRALTLMMEGMREDLQQVSCPHCFRAGPPPPSLPLLILQSTQTQQAHLQICQMFRDAALAVARLTEDFDLADFHVRLRSSSACEFRGLTYERALFTSQIREAVEDDLWSRSTDVRLQRHGATASPHWRSTFKSTTTTRRVLNLPYIALPDRLDSPTLSIHLHDLHDEFERFYSLSLKGIFDETSVPLDFRSCAPLAISNRWRQSRIDHPSFELARGDKNGLLLPGSCVLSADCLQLFFWLIRLCCCHSRPSPPILPEDIHRLVIQCAVQPGETRNPFTQSPVFQVFVEQRQLLHSFRLVCRSWEAIVEPMLHEHLYPRSNGSVDHLNQVFGQSLDGADIVQSMVVPPNSLVTRRMSTSFPVFNNLRILEGLPVPTLSSPHLSLHLPKLEELSLLYQADVGSSQAIRSIFPLLSVLKRLQLRAINSDLHHAFLEIARLDLPLLEELQLSRFAFRDVDADGPDVSLIALLMKHGYKLRLLFLDSVSFPSRWYLYPDTLLTLCPHLRHLSIDVPKLGRLLDVRHVNLETIQLGDSQAILSTDLLNDLGGPLSDY